MLQGVQLQEKQPSQKWSNYNGRPALQDEEHDARYDNAVVRIR